MAKELPHFAKQLLARADTSAFDRASALFATGKFAEAEAAFLKAKDKALADAGQPVVDAIIAFEGAGYAAFQELHFDDAVSHFRAAAAMWNRDHDPEEWAWAQHRVAMVLAEQGKHEEAQTILVEVLTVRGHVLGADHPDTLDALADLANAGYAQGKYSAAEMIYREIILIRHVDRTSSGILGRS